MDTGEPTGLYITGQLIGRLLMSFVLVWLGALLFKRGRWREALVFTRRPLGIVAILTLFLLGLLGATLRVAGGA